MYGRESFLDELIKVGALKSVLTPDSTNVRGWSYNAKTQQLDVTFRSGGTYRYSEVPPAVARALRRNKSAGKTIHRWVKTPGFAYEKIANGDMLEYFAKHPKKLRAYRERKKCEAARLRTKEAGAAKKQVTFDGIKCKLEYLPGDMRSGMSRDGKKWSRTMHDGYGYVHGTKGMGADKEALDVYLAKDPEIGKKVYKVRQLRRDGGYDEDKFMVGYSSASAAKKAYLRHMPEWAFGSMSSMSMEKFRHMTKKGSRL